MKFSIGYSIFNFCILLFFLYVLIKSFFQPFFYGRRSEIKNKMVSKAWDLRKASLRFKKAQKEIDALPDDVAIRRKNIEKGTREECAQILKKADESRIHILEMAKDRAEKEKDRSVEMVRERIFLYAIRRTEENVKKNMTSANNDQFIEQNLNELKTLI